jgi:hypothetical protein
VLLISGMLFCADIDVYVASSYTLFPTYFAKYVSKEWQFVIRIFGYIWSILSRNIQYIFIYMYAHSNILYFGESSFNRYYVIYRSNSTKLRCFSLQLPASFTAIAVATAWINNEKCQHVLRLHSLRLRHSNWEYPSESHKHSVSPTSVTALTVASQTVE